MRAKNPRSGGVLSPKLDVSKRIAEFRAKTHFNEGTRAQRLHYLLGGAIVILSTMSAVAIVAPALVSLWIGALTAASSVALAGILTIYNPSEHATRHNILGAEYLKARKEATWILDVKGPDSSTSDKQLEQEVDDLRDRESMLDRIGATEITSGRAYELAIAGIASGEADYKVDG